MELAVQWRGKLNGKIAAAIPVWASDHWTLLMLTRDDVTKDDWMVEYRDSLTIQSDACARTAKKLLEIASAATGKDLVLPERCNQCRQPKRIWHVRLLRGALDRCKDERGLQQ